jgi:hypothetical protein
VTRKDYEILARAIWRAEANFDGLNGKSQTALSIADALTQDNPRFDREKFLKACGL